MLQRAASNAYSWWMASHIRTKQSKWMEQNLHDMEEKVSAVLKLIEEDGDSFIQKANMYYKKRPEIVSFVQEFFRAYRALADRYDHLSTELQNANNTIASICPDQVRGLEDDDDFECAPRVPKMPSDNTGKVPKVPKLPVKELRFIATTKKKVQEKKSPKPAAPLVKKSGLTKEEGVGEIDRIQKLILALQTEKEFVKSSYETRLAKYREVENEIKEQQEKVDSLQDEFGESKVIEDEEARNLMAATALKSCKETLDQLKQSQEKSAIEAQVERKRTQVSRGKVDALKKLFLSIESAMEVKRIAEERAKKRKAHVDVHAESETGDADSEADVAEKIDVLVNKVTSLETANSSQVALIQRLKSENDELQQLTQSLEDGKANLVDGNQDLKTKMIDLELKWQGVEDLNHTVETLNNNMESHFNDAQSNFNELSRNVQPVENLESLKTSPLLSKYQTKANRKKAKAGKEFLKPKAGKEFLKPKITSSSAEIETEKGSERSQELDSVPISANVDDTGALKEVNSVVESAADGSDASKVLKSGDESCKVSETSGYLSAMAKVVGQASSLIGNTVSESDSKEKELAALSETLEETKKKLMEVETNHQNQLFEITLQLKELKDLNAKKDEVIRHLRMKQMRGQTGIGKSKDESAEEFQACYGKLPEPETKTTTTAEAPPVPAVKKEVEEDSIPKPVIEPEPISAIEAKFRTDIDELLEENLDFWFRFSSTLCEVQKFQTGVKDLEAEVIKLEERQKSEGSSTSKYSVKSDVRPLYTHLREMQTELSLWVEKAESLKEELKNRSASLCEIQDEITKALKASAEDEEIRFTSYQAAKFQGEILNMKQENKRVGDELQVGLDLAGSLQRDAYRALTKLSDDWGLSGPKGNQGGPAEVRSNVPLRSFIFGVKQKKQKASIFSVVQLQPALQQLQPALPKKSNKSGHSGSHR
ncbi:Networked 2D [Hibiscus trionum]|uniref:Networked 2D n=1 Tax=Hibiscus trionum TaxID=183268 RepID=A0A9W7IFG6_HIBTR|nr:Networked 2D [Hibiscus trionum]